MLRTNINIENKTIFISCLLHKIATMLKVTGITKFASVHNPHVLILDTSLGLIGFSLLILLSIYVSYNDILRLF